jgi:hypothetical protein
MVVAPREASGNKIALAGGTASVSAEKISPAPDNDPQRHPRPVHIRHAAPRDPSSRIAAFPEIPSAALAASFAAGGTDPQNPASRGKNENMTTHA